MIVVDASLAAKWVLEEQDSDRALRFAADYRGTLHAPDLVLTEVAGAIVRRANERLLTSSESARIVTQWLAFERRGALALYRPTADSISEAARLAIELGPSHQGLRLPCARDAARLPARDLRRQVPRPRRRALSGHQAAERARLLTR